MILNPDWHKPKEKPYFHQISLDCIEKLVECIERFNKGEIDADTSSKIEKQILVDEFDDEEFLEFAIENLIELISYIDIRKSKCQDSDYFLNRVPTSITVLSK
ncbi:MAG: hypothetical protein V3T09_04730 [bacterium]